MASTNWYKGANWEIKNVGTEKEPAAHKDDIQIALLMDIRTELKIISGVLRHGINPNIEKLTRKKTKSQNINLTVKGATLEKTN
jgi:hypothetical protein